jgi:hypothetical protein
MSDVRARINKHERGETAMKRMIVLAVSIFLAFSLAAPTLALGQAAKSPKPSGATGELVTAWWQWALSKPVEDNPLFGGDPNYTEEQCDGKPLGKPGTGITGDTWFLAGTFNGSEVERTCNMPTDRQLFFPVFNVAVIADADDTEAELLAQAHDFIDAVLADPDFSMVVTVDGKAVPNGKIVRAEAGLFSGKSPLLSEDGTTPVSYQAVADGFWVKLPPLSAGEHTIHWEVSAPNADTDPDTPGAEGFFQNNTYYLTVVSNK